MRAISHFQKMGKLIYELELPVAWKIYSVVSIAQLEPLFFGENLYDRPKFNHFPAVEMKNDIPTYQSYEIEKLVDKRVRKDNKNNVTQYLMKWLKYVFEHDQWEKKRFQRLFKIGGKIRNVGTNTGTGKSEKKNVAMVENNDQMIIKYTSGIAGFFFRSLHIVAE